MENLKFKALGALSIDELRKSPKILRSLVTTLPSHGTLPCLLLRTPLLSGEIAHLQHSRKVLQRLFNIDSKLARAVQQTLSILNASPVTPYEPRASNLVFLSPFYLDHHVCHRGAGRGALQTFHRD